MFDYNLIFNQKEFPLPVISVGNITVGGTGKTPHIEYLVELLRKEWNVATLSRGYLRKSKGFILSDNRSTVFDIGDEPKQIRQKFPDIEVAVDGNRVRGINRLINKDGKKLDLILLDDAYQHRHVKPGLSILLIDYNQPFTSDHYLPYGRLRESPLEKRRAHIIIITKSPEDLKPIERRIQIKDLQLFPYQKLFFTALRYGPFTSVFPGESNYNDTVIRKGGFSFVLITGIVNSTPFKNYLANHSSDIRHLEFPDHYFFKPKDIDRLIQVFNGVENPLKIIVTTEKDAMRLQEIPPESGLIGLPVFYVPLSIVFIHDDLDDFNKLITDYVRKNKTNSLLYSRKS
jgi:tetraacyldisaccharide 4'-kinase